MKLKCLFPLLSMAALLSTAASQADVPRVIPFQAVVKTAAGAPPTGPTPLTFRLYSAAIGGAALWSESQTVPPVNSLVTVALGSVTPFPDSIRFDALYWIGVTVGSDPEMTPRIPLLSVPYALSLSGVSTDPATGDIGIGGPADRNGKLRVAVNTVTGEVVDQQNSSGDGYGAAPLFWQSFTAGKTGLMTALSLAINHTFTARLSFYAGEGTNGTPLLSQGVSFDVANPAPKVRLATPLPVTAGQIYTWELVPDIPQQSGIGIKLSNTYPGGHSNYSPDSDYVFTTYVAQAGPTTDAVFVDNQSANVGIGTQTPLGRLGVVGGGIATDSYYGFSAVQQGNVPVGVYMAAPAQESLALYTNGAERLRVDPYGAVGVGTTAPTAPLDVKSNTPPQLRVAADTQASYGATLSMNARAIAGGQDWFMFSSGANASEGQGKLIFRDVTNGIYGITMAPDGTVGIGTQSPQYSLDVAGVIRANNVSVTSDARLKQDVRPLADALSTVESLRGVSYEWRRDRPQAERLPGGRQVGFLAQQVEKVLPEVVSTAPDGYKSVSYQSIVPVLVEAVKQQQREIAAQRKQIDDLKREVRRRKRR